MKEPTLISICIPAYKRIQYLARLFSSIEIQTYRNYEVIITDDSPDDTVKEFIGSYSSIKTVRYYRNKNILGTPENWNESIRKANGVWIKLMHDDDWFANANSLQLFYEATIKNPACSFFFGAYNNVDEISKSKKLVCLNAIDRAILRLSPLNLFKRNYIGNPSCTLIKRDINLFYDSDFKWVVDFDYFIRCLRKSKNYFYINTIVINIGLNEEQVTKASFRVPEVEIPESHLLMKKMGAGVLRNFFVYDYYWRLYRNLGIKDESDIKRYNSVQLHPLLKQIICFQKKIPSKILTVGIFSKLTMFCNYLVSLFSKL